MRYFICVPFVYLISYSHFVLALSQISRSTSILFVAVAKAKILTKIPNTDKKICKIPNNYNNSLLFCKITNSDKQFLLTENLKQTWNKKNYYIWAKSQILTIIRCSWKISNSDNSLLQLQNPKYYKSQILTVSSAKLQIKSINCCSSKKSQMLTIDSLLQLCKIPHIGCQYR